MTRGSSSHARTFRKRATSRLRNPGPRIKTDSSWNSVRIKTHVLSKLQLRSKEGMLRCATAASGGSPIRPGWAGPRKRMRNYCNWWANSATIPGRASSLPSRVTLLWPRPHAQANQGPLHELPQARSPQELVDSGGGSRADSPHKQLREGLEGDRVGAGGPQSQSNQEQVLWEDSSSEQEENGGEEGWISFAYRRMIIC